MHLQPNPICSEHRLARFILWLSALLAWFAAGALQRSLGSQRHHRRYGALKIETLTQAVRNIIIIRAAQLLNRLPPGRVQRHSNTRPGFRQAAPHHYTSMRVIVGAPLRRALRSRGSFIQRVMHLIAVLRRVDVYAQDLADCRRRPFTRLRAITPIAPPHDAVRGICALAPVAADSS